jgi:hypothetical protein
MRLQFRHEVVDELRDDLCCVQFHVL